MTNQLVRSVHFAVTWFVIFAQTPLLITAFPRPSAPSTSLRFTIPTDFKSPVESNSIDETDWKKLLRKPISEKSSKWLLQNAARDGKFELSKTKKKSIGSPAKTFSITVDLPSGDFNYTKPVDPGGQILHRTASNHYSYFTSGCVDLQHVQLRFLLQAYFHHGSQTCFALYFLAMRNLQLDGHPDETSVSSAVKGQLKCR